MAALNLFRIFRSARSPSKTRHTFRPMLEALDARDVPAVLTWTDATGDDQFLTPGNWTSSDIPSGQPQLATPHEGDDLLFVNFASAGGGGAPGGLSGASGPQGGSPNCYGMQSDPEGPYNSIFVTGGYTGTITVTGPVQSLALAMEAPGTIDQPDPSSSPGQLGGSDISVLSGAETTLDNEFLLSTVQNAFTWTDGTINSTSNLSNLWLEGGTASINPGGGTLTIGDNISLDNGTVATLAAGTVNATNNASLLVNSSSSLILDPGIGNVAQLTPPVLVNTGTFVTIKTGNDVLGPPIVNGGTFTVNESCVVVIAGVGATGKSYVQTSGQTILIGGGAIGVLAGGMLMSGGTLMTQTVQYGTDSNGTISGNLTVTGGDIYIDAPTHLPHAFGELHVGGNVNWTGGTYHPGVSSCANTADFWSCSGTFTIGGAATLEAVLIDGEGGIDTSSTPSSSYSWTVITAITGIVAAPNTPTITGAYSASFWISPITGGLPKSLLLTGTGP